jgi:hypothetical protein
MSPAVAARGRLATMDLPVAVQCNGPDWPMAVLAESMVVPLSMET